ncbi:MAG: ABC transporter permease, partial [Chlamydiota bacterium]|nr:ABC transporter permease [Chlamydiota bacterium]
MKPWWIQSWGLFQREVRRYCKVPLQTLGAPLMNTSLYLLIFGFGLGRAIGDIEGTSYMAFLIPGLIAMSLIKGSFENSTSSLVSAKYTNELQDLRVAPLTGHQICLAKGLASLSRGLLVGSITYLTSQLLLILTGYPLVGIDSLFSLLFFILLGGMTFSCLGIAFGMWAKNFEQISALSLLILLPMTYLGGLFFSIDSLNSLWKTLAQCNPLYYVITGIRHAILGGELFSYALILVAYLGISYSMA